MNEAPDLRIGGLVIVNQARIKFTQSYRKLSRRADQRTAGGSAIRWTLWDGKLETTIDLIGWEPPGLADLAEAGPLLVSCAQRRAVDSASNVIDLPAERRSGSIYDPIGYAEVRGQLVETPLVMAGDQATLTVVPNADRYRAQYFPEFSALISISNETLASETAEFQVTITAQQV